MSRETIVDLKLEITKLQDRVEMQERQLHDYARERDRHVEESRIVKQTYISAIYLVEKVLSGELDSNKIASIFLYFAREEPDLLIEANGESLAVGGISSQLKRRLISELRENHKIQAIKICREVTGFGLREAKDVVDAIERQMCHV